MAEELLSNSAAFLSSTKLPQMAALALSELDSGRVAKGRERLDDH
jgi:hypothetical protein